MKVPKAFNDSFLEFFKENLQLDIMIVMLNQKGVTSLIIIFVGLILLGIGFYGGTKYQKPSQKSEIAPGQNFAAKPIQSLSPTQASTNTEDSSAPTFIKVLSPNGGESFKVGDTMHITWSSKNLTKSGYCIITLIHPSGRHPRYGETDKDSKWAPVNTKNGYYDWKISSESGGHQEKVNIDCYDSSSNNIDDQSDNYFTITN